MSVVSNASRSKAATSFEPTQCEIRLTEIDVARAFGLLSNRPGLTP
jgi:hypothetical protein